MPNFADEANWLSVYDNFIVGVSGTRIPSIVVPNSLSYRFLRVTSNNQNARDTWTFGGLVFLMVDEPSPQVQVLRWRSPVNEPAILVVPDFLASYRVTVKPPVWFKEISLEIEGYIGV